MIINENDIVNEDNNENIDDSPIESTDDNNDESSDNSIYRDEVDMQITGYMNGQIEVSMTNSIAVGGFQFDIDAGDGLTNLAVSVFSNGFIPVYGDLKSLFS